MSGSWNIRPFSEHDFEYYSSWFEDEELNRRLGPLDEEWLSHVLNSKDGEQWVVTRNNIMMAVVGVIFPIPSHPHHVISDLAVNPKYKRQGIGKKTIELLISLKGYKGAHWLAYVDHRNEIAKEFFKNLHWISDESLSTNDMLTYSFT